MAGRIHRILRIFRLNAYEGFLLIRTFQKLDNCSILSLSSAVVPSFGCFAHRSGISFSYAFSSNIYSC